LLKIHFRNVDPQPGLLHQRIVGFAVDRAVGVADLDQLGRQAEPAFRSPFRAVRQIEIEVIEAAGNHNDPRYKPSPMISPPATMPRTEPGRQMLQ
jgi:hypothetical protein